MLFSSITFLYRFLPAVLLLYAVMPRRGKNAVMLAASLIFYFWGEPKYTILLLISSLSDYLHGLYIESHRGQPSAKIALVSSVVINLLMLGVFKYLDFFIGTANTLLGTTIPQPGLKLPIGISFFTFQTMSYSIDVYRGDAKAEKNLLSFATYVCLFPQLVAGPIVRYTDVSAELSGRKLTLDRFALGARRFAVGLGKKVLIANLLGELCAVYAGAEAKTVLFAWLNALAWMLQVYYDFSGYSDMAIGLGHMLGFTFPENFNYPFCSRTITEFWRRWHMTLSGWFRDYVYIPLGGSRVSTAKWVRNVMTVWLLTGLWHGAAGGAQCGQGREVHAGSAAGEPLGLCAVCHEARCHARGIRLQAAVPQREGRPSGRCLPFLLRRGAEGVAGVALCLATAGCVTMYYISEKE